MFMCIAQLNTNSRTCSAIMSVLSSARVDALHSSVLRDLFRFIPFRQGFAM